MKVQTLSTGVTLVMDSSVRLPFESFLASPPIKVSCFCRSSIYSACKVHSFRRKKKKKISLTGPEGSCYWNIS